MSDSEFLYDDLHIAFLEDLWGEGFLSPGGAAEAAQVVEGLDLKGKRMLDIGCGSGAIAVMLVRDLGAGHVTGIDVETPVCDAARSRAAEAGLSDRITVLEVVPGPFDFPDESFDVVYSKDSIIHIPDKEALAAEVFRILKPGGWFAASDWLISHDGPPSPEMQAYIAAENLDFAMASPSRYARALNEAGFTGIELRNRNSWYRETARGELERLKRDHAKLSERFGAEFIDGQIVTWTAMIRVLDSGEHCPHHLRAQRPV